MKFFIYSHSGESTWLAQRLEAEGNQVHYFVEGGGIAGAGLVNRVEVQEIEGQNYPRGAQILVDRFGRDTVFIFDANGRGRLADGLRSLGCPVVGSGLFNDMLARDEAYGSKILGLTRLTAKPQVRFHSWSGLTDYLKECPGQYQLTTPDGRANGPSEYLISLVKVLSRGSQIAEVELEERPTAGVYTVGMWFNGYDFAFPAYALFQEPGGWVAFAFKHWRPRQFRDIHLPLRMALRKVGYCGPLQLSLSGTVGLRWTTHIDPCTFAVYAALLEGDIGKTLSDIARSQTRNMRPSGNYAVGVLMLPPPNHPFPVNGATWPFEASRALQLMNVLRINGGFEVEQGGMVGVVVGQGSTLRRGQQAAYDAVEQVVLPGAVYIPRVGDGTQRLIAEVLANVA